MAENLQINDILNLVKETNKNLEKTYFIPSLKTETIVKPMTAGHLKQIVTSSLSGIFANNKFNQIVYNIIKDIFVDKEVVSKLTTFDKIAILLQMRKFNVKKNVVVVGYSTNDSLVSLNKILDIDEQLLKIKNGDFQFDDVIVKADNFEVTLSFPTLSEENKFNTYIENTYANKIDENDKNSIKTFFGPLFINEIVQYIKTIKIGERLINVLDLSIDHRLKLFESLSGNVVSEIIGTIDQKLGSQIREALTVRFIEDSSEEYIGKIDVDLSILT